MGFDLAGVKGELEFSDLAISDGDEVDTTISITATSEILTVVLGVTKGLPPPMTLRLSYRERMSRHGVMGDAQDLRIAAPKTA